MTPYRSRTLTAPRSSFFLFGPRGTGKTTWVRHEYPQAYRIDLLDEALYQSYLADVGRFAGELRAVAPSDWVFVDEIQRLPGLLNEVHRHIEGGDLRFILTGSSARKLKRAGVNLLAVARSTPVCIPSCHMSWGPTSISTRCSGTAAFR